MKNISKPGLLGAKGFDKRNRGYCKSNQHWFLVRAKTRLLREKPLRTEKNKFMGHVLHNNRVKFPKDFFLFCSVHQHGGDDVKWIPPIQMHSEIQAALYRCHIVRYSLMLFWLKTWWMQLKKLRFLKRNFLSCIHFDYPPGCCVNCNLTCHMVSP